MKIIAVIPARGGSKRFPMKNIAQFRGRPIISYTIEAALQTRLFEKVVVSTEDNKIAEVAGKFGAEIHNRPKELAADMAGVVDVCLNILQSESREGRNFDIMCCLYATAPLRKAEDIKKVVEFVKCGQCNFAMAVTECCFPPYQALQMDPNGFLEPMWPDLVNKKRQAFPEMVIDNGSTYVVSVPVFMKVKSFYGPNLKGYIMPRSRSIDIDLKEDLELAEFYAKRFIK